MRSFLTAALLAALLAPTAHAAPASTPGQEVVSTVQRLFDAMAARDAAGILALLTPEAGIASIRPNQSLNQISGADFAARIAASKDALLERIWQPEVRVAGRIATLWAPYDFHIGTRLSHCGVDSITLFATPEGWKVAGVYYSVVEAAQCAPSPLGGRRASEGARSTGGGLPAPRGGRVPHMSGHQQPGAW